MLKEGDGWRERKAREENEMRLRRFGPSIAAASKE
jgi:hypothetical protein